MGKVLVVGAGGVSSVAVHKMAMNPEIFSEIALASRTKSKCDDIAASVKDRTGVTVATYQLDAMDVAATVALLRATGAELLVNVALPYQDLVLMDACLEAGVNYLDTANYEPEDEAKFEYHWQWAYQDKFQEAGLTAILGSGFDPGVTSVFATWLRKHKLSGIRQLDVLDCNGGDNGKAFATNFNPEINIREVTAPARHWEAGQWVESPAMTHKVAYDFPGVGTKNMYLMYHEELESLSTHFPEIERARFWMTFGDAYINHVTVLENIGMTSIQPVMHNGVEIIPLQFLKTVLPDPGDLGALTKGKTCIGDIATGPAIDGSGEKTFYIYNICDHEECYAEVGSQAVAYTTGVPAMIGAAMVLTGAWKEAGVWNMEQLDPDPFMEMLNTQGLPWQVVELDAPVDF
ncbi:saccharopine dehydrogenase family protein [Pseudoruegeria sp. SK021]|uniref:saccharopine dehydrogenase family protein n=1 Tax=Pseudoruegeria sp. SK021 TaxID=1933035 RepID=UPI000A23372E|nr:saccharopine dehydrogenase family protein [Pseudoruegeria sp. SK021]OSP54555.1 saccharopine dehydrogenase [Pseudoruegeria sp. SK021]